MVEERGKVVDLMAALEQSLARAGAGDGDGEEEDEEALPPAASGRAKKATKKRAGRSRKSA